MRPVFFINSLLFLILINVKTFSQTQIDLLPMADTYVSSCYPYKNFGMSTILKIGRSYSTICYFRTYILFDVSKFIGKNIKKAELRIYQLKGYGAGSLPKHINEVLSPWDQFKMTWNTKAKIGKRIASFNAGNSFFKGWIGIDVTSLVKLWLKGKPNYGLAIKHPDEKPYGASRPADIYSRECPNPKYIPVLRLNFSTRIFGKGCGKKNPPYINYNGEPSIGKKFHINLYNSIPNGKGFLILGRSSKKWLGFSLPLDLSKYGFSGCNLYTSMFMIFPIGTDLKGFASRVFYIPNVIELRGFSTFWQWIAVDPLYNIATQFSNALEAEIY